MTAYKKIQNTLAVGTILVTACLSVSCASYTNNTQTAQVGDWLHSVVEVQTRDDNDEVIGNATGAAIRKDGLILTNKHVVLSYDYQKNEYSINNNIYTRWYNSDEL